MSGPDWRRDPVIQASELASLGRVRLLDARPVGAPAETAPPGAARVPLEAWIAAARSEAHGLADTGGWQAWFEDLELEDGITALVFDGGELTEAARVWFILQYFGVPALVIDGGLPSLALHLLPGRAAALGAGLTLSPGSGPVGLVDRHELRQKLDRFAVLDARSRAEFDGQDLRDNRRGGHLPGAKLLPHGNLLRDGRLLPLAELRRLIDAAGFAPGEALVTHCQGGGRAALAAIAALRAGYDDVRVYYRSFGDWAADESCPIVR